MRSGQRGLWACGVAVGLLAGCQPGVWYSVRHRDLSQFPEGLAEAYPEEREYIARRRDGLGGDLETPYTGIALSGGGIRSATFSLGVLQALEEQGALSRIDYMSAVSGGGYTAAWIQAHLGNRPEDGEDDRDYFSVDRFGYEAGADDFGRLLDDRGDLVAAVRDRSGFLRQDGFFEAGKLLGSWLVRYPIYVVLDLGLHVKGRLNAHSLLGLYKNRIEATFLQGESGPPGRGAPRKAKTHLREINRDPTKTPYLILSANLVNTAPGSVWKEIIAEDATDYAFEFTRDYVGSDLLGYIPPAAFDRRIYATRREGGVLQEIQVLRGGDRRFRLSRAAAATGAAFDPDGFLPRLPGAFLRNAAAYALLPLNINLGYETFNYAHGSDRLLWLFWQYARMLTWERLPFTLSSSSAWIKITDGGHYDNTGVFALLRRGVQCVVAVDASADPDRKYRDLEALERRARQSLNLRFVPAVKEAIRGGAGFPDAAYAFDLVFHQGDRAGMKAARILYLKPNADLDRDLPHLADRERSSVLKVREYKANAPGWLGRANRFPHTTTLLQWYDRTRFEAYRLLGYEMARTYLPGRSLGDPERRGCELSGPGRDTSATGNARALEFLQRDRE